MKIVAEYRRNAEECRKLAKLVFKPDDKKILEEMATTWDKLADDLDDA
jgi:hypothetical protein